MVGGLSWGYVSLSWGYVGLSWGQYGRILGLCWPNLELCWPILGAMLAHLGAMLAHLGGYVGPSWSYVGPSWGLCWPMLTHLEPHVRCLCKNMLNVTGPKNTVNYRGFCRHAHPTARSAAGAAAPLSYGEERNAYCKDTARGPLAGFKRLRATAGQGPMLRWYESSWEQDRKAMLPHVEARLVHLGAVLARLGGRLAHLEAYVDLCWAKRAEKWEQQKYIVKRRIFWRSAAYLGAMLAHLGAMLAYLEGNVGPSWGYVGPSWGYVGPSWGYVGPSWGFLGPSWGLC